MDEMGEKNAPGSVDEWDAERGGRWGSRWFPMISAKGINPERLDGWTPRTETAWNKAAVPGDLERFGAAFAGRFRLLFGSGSGRGRFRPAGGGLLHPIKNVKPGRFHPATGEGVKPARDRLTPIPVVRPGHPLLRHPQHGFLLRDAIEVGDFHPAQVVGFVGEGRRFRSRGSQRVADVPVQVFGFDRACGDPVDVDVEYLRRDGLDGAQAGFLVSFAHGDAQYVPVAVGMAAELDPLVQLLVVSEQDAKARSVDQPRRPSDVAGLQGAIEGIGVGGQELDEPRRDLGFVGPAVAVVHQLPYERVLVHLYRQGRAGWGESQFPQRETFSGAKGRNHGGRLKKDRYFLRLQRFRSQHVAWAGSDLGDKGRRRVDKG
jgi:hypothetical protein